MVVVQLCSPVDHKIPHRCGRVLFVPLKSARQKMKVKQSSKTVKVLENGTEQGAGLKCPASLGSTAELGMTSHLRCYRKASFIG